MKNYHTGSLTIVGFGIKCLSHLTMETSAYIKEADKVLYSVNEPVMESWIIANNANAVSLDSLVTTWRLRKDLYKMITSEIIANVKNNHHVCVVFYGHPTIFAKSALDAAHKTKADGYPTKILPGISAEDCLFADLWIDPGSHGCHSYEATDFIIRQRDPDPSCHLILWQAGIIGALGSTSHHDNKHGVIVLRDHLMKFFPSSHIIIAYEAALYPHTEPRIQPF